MPARLAKPLRQHALKTVMLRVPSAVWPLVSTGRISEFRAASGNVPQLWKVPLPTLAVCYRRQLSLRRYDYKLMTLVDVRREALGAITEDGLARAGYEGDDARARFRRDWVIAEKRRFEPLRNVFVFRVRPVFSLYDDAVNAALVRHLYGEYLDQGAHRKVCSVNV